MVSTDGVRRRSDTDTLDPDTEDSRSSAKVLRLTVLHHPDPRWIGAVWQTELPEDSEAQVVGRAIPLFTRRGDGHFTSLGDPHVSRKMLRLRRKGGAVEIAPLSRSTAVALDFKRLKAPARLAVERLDRDGALVELAGRVLLFLDRVEVDQLPETGFVGISAAARATRDAIADQRRLDVPVLVLGEPGSGKGVVARALHDASPRASGPWVELDAHALHVSTDQAAAIADIPAEWVFPRAFEMAQRGTLVIDGLENADSRTQAQLLAQLKGLMLASGDAWNLGLVTTMTADPGRLVSSGQVTISLLDRLGVGTIMVPPLRMRPADIPLLLHCFLDEQFTKRGGWPEQASVEFRRPWLRLPLVAELMTHSFPGNVRELQNLAFQLAVHSGHEHKASLPPALKQRVQAQTESRPRFAALRERSDASVRTPQRLAARKVRSVLKANRWNVTAAARELGVARNTLLAFIDRTPGFRRIKDVPTREIRTVRERLAGDDEALADELEVSLHGLRIRLSEIDNEG